MAALARWQRRNVSRRAALQRFAASLAPVAVLVACGGTATAQPTAVAVSTPSSAAAVVSSSSAVATTTASTTAIVASTPTTSLTSSSLASSSALSSATTSSPSAAATSPASSGGGVVFWSNSGYPYKDHVGADLVKQFEQGGGPAVDYIDTTYNDFMEKLLTTVAAGTPPDLSYVDDYVPQSYACRGVLSALDDMMSQSKVVNRGIFWPGIVGNNVYKGKMYGIPHGTDVGLLYFNQDLFKAAGLDPSAPPATWDAALTVAGQLTRKQGSDLQQVGWPPFWGWSGTQQWMLPYWQLGGELVTADESMPTFNNDQALQAMDWGKKLYDLQGGFDAVTKLITTGLKGRQAFVTGRSAMVFATHAAQTLDFKGKTNFPIGSTFWPLPTGGKHANYISGWSLVIPKGAKNAAGAFQFLEFLCGNGPQVAWALGWNCQPSVVAAAQSPQFLNADPLNKLAIAESPTAKYIITAPGGDKILGLMDKLVTTVMRGQQTPHDALQTTSDLVQQALTDAEKNCVV